MLKRLRAAHPILYCILAEVLFLGSLFLSSLVLTVALVAAGADFSGLDEYLLSLVQELVGAGAAWLLLRRTGRQGLLERLLENLLGNSIRHNAAPVEIEVQTDVAGNRFCLTVADNGTGLSLIHI